MIMSITSTLGFVLVLEHSLIIIKIGSLSLLHTVFKYDMFWWVGISCQIANKNNFKFLI